MIQHFAFNCLACCTLTHRCSLKPPWAVLYSSMYDTVSLYSPLLLPLLLPITLFSFSFFLLIFPIFDGFFCQFWRVQGSFWIINSWTENYLWGNSNIYQVSLGNWHFLGFCIPMLYCRKLKAAGGVWIWLEVGSPRCRMCIICVWTPKRLYFFVVFVLVRVFHSHLQETEMKKQKLCISVHL